MYILSVYMNNQSDNQTIIILKHLEVNREKNMKEIIAGNCTLTITHNVLPPSYNWHSNEWLFV